MTARVSIFTCPNDYPLADLATRAALRNGLPVAWVIGADDSETGIPATATVIRSAVPRNGNLRGHAWIKEQLRIMAALAAGVEWLVKLDSDTVIGRMDWLASARHSDQLVGSFHHAGSVGRVVLRGPCYALRSSVLPRLVRAAAALSRFDTTAEEDVTVGSLVPTAERCEHWFSRRGGMLSGWRWDSGAPLIERVRRHEVITVQPDPCSAPEESRHQREAVMRKLVAAGESSPPCRFSPLP